MTWQLCLIFLGVCYVIFCGGYFQIAPFLFAFQADLTMVGELFTGSPVGNHKHEETQKAGDTMYLNDVYENRPVPEPVKFQILVSFVHKGQEDLKGCFFLQVTGDGSRDPRNLRGDLYSPLVLLAFDDHVTTTADDHFTTTKVHIGVSKNRGTPKSSILIGFSIINHPFWG